MKKITILIGSVRKGRQSPKLSLYFKKYIENNNLANVDIIDLKEYNFPLFDERLKFQKDPDVKAIEFANKIRETDAVMVIAPEYNGSFSAAIKNAIDLLKEEWYHKPIGIITVSNGNFGGIKCQVALQQTFNT